MLEHLSRYWWTLAIRGALAVLFGLAALIWPDITLRVLVWLFGFYAVVDGLLALAALLIGGRVVSGRRGWLILFERFCDALSGPPRAGSPPSVDGEVPKGSLGEHRTLPWPELGTSSDVRPAPGP